MKPNHNHSIPWLEPSIAFGRVLNNVVDVAALVVALGECEAQAALLRLHQGHVELHFLQKKKTGLNVKRDGVKATTLDVKCLFVVSSYRDKVLHVLPVAGHGEV